MKKLISILLAFMMLLALTVPASAAKKIISGDQTINGGEYPDGIQLKMNSTVTIEGTVEISTEFNLNYGSTMIISQNAKLVGKDLTVSAPMNNKIIICGINDGNNVTDGTEGKIDITVKNDHYADYFTNILAYSGCSNYTQDGNHFVIGCPHDHTTTETEVTTTTTTQTTTTTTDKVYCKDCEAVVHTEVKTETGEPQVTTTTSTDSGAASTLSEGNMTIVCTVAAAVIFGLGGFILGRKKLKTED